MHYFIEIRHQYHIMEDLIYALWVSKT